MRQPPSNERLLKRMQAGGRARRILAELETEFEKIQGEYFYELVTKVREGTESDVFRVACRIAALDDVYSELADVSDRGARAQEEATRRERQEVDA